MIQLHFLPFFEFESCSMALFTLSIFKPYYSAMNCSNYTLLLIIVEPSLKQSNVVKMWLTDYNVRRPSTYCLYIFKVAMHFRFIILLFSSRYQGFFFPVQ